MQKLQHMLLTWQLSMENDNILSSIAAQQSREKSNKNSSVWRKFWCTETADSWKQTVCAGSTTADIPPQQQPHNDCNQ